LGDSSDGDRDGDGPVGVAGGVVPDTVLDIRVPAVLLLLGFGLFLNSDTTLFFFFSFFFPEGERPSSAAATSVSSGALAVL